MSREAAEFKSRFAPDQEVVHLREQVASLEAQLKREKQLTGEARLQTIQTVEAIGALEPVRMVYKSGNKATQPLTYCLHLTDLHMGEVTEADEVEGFGAFSPTIFHERLETLAKLVIDFVSVQRNGYSIPNLQIIGTGDYVSGGIHQELLVTNEFPEPVQSVRCAAELAALVRTFAPHFEKVTCDWITLDNHGRLTKKNQAAEGGLNNWGYVVAHGVEAITGRLANVEHHIWSQPSHLLRLPGARYLIFHGHQIKGWAGIPYYGFERRVAMEATKRLGVESAEFDKLVFGHFHMSTDLMNVNTGGSLSGTNAFDHSCGRHARAHQTGWLLHPKHGQFAWSRWWLQ